MKPDILKQKIASLLSRIDSIEFLEGLQLSLKEQLESEQRESLHQESIKRMNKRRTATPKTSKSKQ
jgi:hypothetical protein